MNNELKKLLKNKPFKCPCNQDDSCIIRKAVVGNDKVKSLSIDISNKTNTKKCIFLQNKNNFMQLLLYLDYNGYVNIFFKGKYPNFIEKKTIEINYDYSEYIANHNFTVFFPKENLNTINFYYSYITNRRTIRTKILKWIIKLKLNKIIELLYSENKSIVLQKK